MSTLEPFLWMVLLVAPVAIAYLVEQGWQLNGPGLAMVAGALFAIPGAWLVLGGWLSDSWKLVTAVIIKADVTGSDGYRSRGWYPRVKYRYTVGEREYVGSRFSFGSVGYYYIENAEDDIALYHPGRKVVVYVHPRIPALSVMHPGMHWMPFVFLFGGLAIIAGAFLLQLSPP